MCLFAQNIKPLASKKDLIVCKKLLINNAGKIVTPYYFLNVEYGENIVASGDMMPLLPSDYSKNMVEENVIHSLIDLFDMPFIYDNYVLVKSVIKAGVEFYVSTDCSEIASRELLLGDVPVGLADFDSLKADLAETRKEIYGLLRNSEENMGRDGIRVGDVLLSDMSFIAPDEVTEESDAIGIAGFIRKDGFPHVISLRKSSEKWSKEVNHAAINSVLDETEAVSDFDGKGHTHSLYEKYKEMLNDFPALKYCLEYETNGTKKGDWFFPSTGEMIRIAKNAYLINATVDKLGCRADSVYSNYWTSTEHYKRRAWVCNGVNEFVWRCAKNASYDIRPSIVIQ